MPGIAGVVYPNAFQVGHLITPMLNSLSHRALEPIQSKLITKNIQVGSVGHQLAHSTKAIAGIDGEIKNHKELRIHLEEHGYPIVGNTPAEIPLYAYELWGDDFTSHLAGDYSLFVVDRLSSRIILLRDRVGKKPLYWFQNQNYFIFASEIKAVLASDVVPQTPSTEGIAHYLFLGYFPQDLTPIKNLNKLLPSHSLRINQDQTVQLRNYWSFSSFCQLAVDEPKEAIIKNFDSLMTAIVTASSKGSSCGSALSGGLGSASIAYYLRKAMPKKEIDAYTVVFEGQNMQDLQAAENVSAQLKLNHFKEIITPNDFLNDLAKIIWFLDEPLADINVLATWRLAQLARKNHCLFSGMGSDELMAGHSRYSIQEHQTTHSQWFLQAIMPLLKMFVLPIVQSLNASKVYGILQQARTNPVHYDYLMQNAVFSEKELAQAAPRIASLFDPHIFLHKFYNLPNISSNVSSMLYLDVKTRLADSYILQYERLLTANGVDWITPYLNQEVMEYLAGLPEPDVLLESDTFYVLKSILKGRIPDSVLDRPKRSRKDFLSTWVEASQLPKMFSLLERGSLVEAGIISEKWLKEQLSNPKQERDSFRYLWSLLILEIWFKMFVDHPPWETPSNKTALELLSEV